MARERPRPLPLAVDPEDAEDAPLAIDPGESLALVVAAQGERTFDGFLARVLENSNRDAGLAIARIDALLERAFPLALTGADGEAIAWARTLLALQKQRFELIERYGAVAEVGGENEEVIDRARLVLERTRTRKVVARKVDGAAEGDPNGTGNTGSTSAEGATPPNPVSDRGSGSGTETAPEPATERGADAPALVFDTPGAPGPAGRERSDSDRDPS